jgi:uncharacterized protein YPO0396
MSELGFSDGPMGFRLERMELSNWGTFGLNKIWSFPFGSANALVTGDIGTGKSTWVDALTTLIVPPQKITYNKAAGAERRERTDKAYLLGEYRNTREENASYAKAINLRDETSYSVILAVFVESSASRLISLAQVRWMRGGEIHRLYVVSGKRLSVKSDFGEFDGEIGPFKKKLKMMSEGEVFDSYSDYAATFRQTMGITEKALDLFNQTVSMKTIGDLDDFIRNHMLEQSKARSSIDGLLRNYDNLRSAHETVERTRKKRDLLKPLVQEGSDYKATRQSLDNMSLMIQALPYFVIQKTLPLIAAESARLGERLSTLQAEAKSLKSQLADERANLSRIEASIESSEVGKRLSELAVELQRLEVERDKKRKLAFQYEGYASSLGYAAPSNQEGFDYNARKAQAELESGEARRLELQADRDVLVAERSGAEEKRDEIERELRSLRSRSTSIPARNLELRAALAAALGLGDAILPFVGELIQVKAEERIWEGSCERVLRGFALSILVPESLYRRVSAYARERDLGDRRLVFIRVPEKVPTRLQLAPNSLARVLEVKAGSPFKPWVEAELARYAGYARCETMEEFYRENDAVTKEGLVKSGKLRHEKDDRRSVSDPRNFVLGWSNKEKIELLERDLSQQIRILGSLEEKLARVDAHLDKLVRQRDALNGLMAFLSFDDLDYRSRTTRYEELRAERESLEVSSDQLAELRRAQGASQASIARLEVDQEARQKACGAVEQAIRSLGEERDSMAKNLAAVDGEIPHNAYEDIEAFLAKEGQGIDLRPALDAVHSGWQAVVAGRLNSRRSGLERKERELRGTLLQNMNEFLGAFPEHRAELRPTAEFLEDFAGLLATIERSELPGFEARFRALLRESTLQDIALFQNELQNDSAAILAAINEINVSLREIEYSPGTYITLLAQRREDQAIADFRNELRGCLENTLGDEELYSEAKFLQVKRLLDRFASGEGVDKSWTDHVTDVRSWFSFMASERWMADDTEKEFYSSSSGKSGGQKEKLAYTILASALAYQYGLGKRRFSGGFRLVAIDEAFGRGSAESTRYGFRLFKQLDLQLILVTPLQKIGVIEEHVESIHLITNHDGTSSEVRSLTIEEYRMEKQAHGGTTR